MTPGRLRMRSCRPQKQPPARIAFSVVMMLLRQSRGRPPGASARFTLMQPRAVHRYFTRPAAGRGWPRRVRGHSLLASKIAPGLREAADADDPADLLGGHA